MTYDLLKEFLECDLSQKDFADKKGMKFSNINKEIWKQMMSLYKSGLVIPRMYQVEMRYLKKHKEEFLTAINKLSNEPKI